ncbi:Outer cell wall protein precursor [Anoxybacillus thermarum]|uniref:Outer cell wall protein n=1 Tax=Anoxybacillus thermarum TaxID=404937 RepID=A0A0D0QYX8_9BACL|nr:Ig-like domain-containing protein [Anoxybacillus thermarum]KIQ94694.1 Outer cell wall protein precursor [Anoxybacillus thermarum]
MTFAFFYRASLGGPDERREQKFATLVGESFLNVTHKYFTHTTKVDVPVVTPKVESVSAINAKQVKVTFNKPVNRVSAEDVDNYTISGDGVTSTSLQYAKLADEKSVILTLEYDNAALSASDVAFANGKEYELTVSKDITFKSGSKLGEDKKVKFTANDVEVPTVKNVTTLASDLIEVEFSEPVKMNSSAEVAANYEIKRIDEEGKEVGVAGLSISAAALTDSDNTKVLLQLSGAQLSPGQTYRIYVNKPLGIVDYAGYKVPAFTKDFKLESDTSVPQGVSAEVIDPKVVLVKFNKYVVAQPTDFYYNTTGTATNKANTATEAVYVGNNTYKVTFGSIMPAGKVYVFADGVYDALGNPAPTAKFEVTVNETQAPAVSSVEVVDSETIKVTFNEDIAVRDTATLDDDGNPIPGNTIQNARKYYEIKDKDGNVILIKDVRVGEKSNGNPDYSVRLIKLYPGNGLKTGANTIKVTGIKGSLDRTIADYTTTINVAAAEKMGVKLIAKKAAGTVNKDQFVLSLDPAKAQPAAEGQYSPLNLENWTVTTTLGTVRNLKDIPGASVTKISDYAYLVSTDKNQLATGDVTLSGLKTADGKSIEVVKQSVTFGTNGASYMDISSISGTNKFVESSTLTKDEITLKVNTLLNSVSAGDFQLYQDGVLMSGNPITSVTFTNNYKDGNSTITIKTTGLDLTSHTYSLKTVTNPGTKDVFGYTLVGSKGLALADTSAATMTKAYVIGDLIDTDVASGFQGAVSNLDGLTADTDGNNNRVIVEFNKAVSDANLNEADFVVVDSKGREYTVSNVESATDGKVLALTTSSALPAGEEFTVKLTKNLSVENVASGNIETRSFYLTGVSAAKGDYAGIYDGKEEIKLSFNQLLDLGMTLPTAYTLTSGNGTGTYESLGFAGLGTLTATISDAANTIVDAAGAVSADIDDNNKDIVITLTGFAGMTEPTNFTEVLEFAPNVSLVSAEGIPVNPVVTKKMSVGSLVSAPSISASFLPGTASFTVTNNYNMSLSGTYTNVDILSTTATGAPVDIADTATGQHLTIDTTATINGAVQTLVATLNSDGSITVTGTANAAVDQDVTFTLTDTATSASTTVTLNLKATQSNGSDFTVTVKSVN